MTALQTPAPDAPAEEWGRLAVSIPGAPAAWHRTDELILVTGDGQHIAPDGTWWRPVACAAGLLSLDPDHPATAGCLLALLGNLEKADELADSLHLRRDQCPSDAVIDAVVSGDSGRISRACIAAAAAHGRWPGGEQ